MSRITPEDVCHVASLARLRVTDDDVAKFTQQLEAILDNAAKIEALDTDGIPVTSHPIEMNNVLRADEVRESFTQEQALSNAPASEDGRFKVPQILGEEE